VTITDDAIQSQPTSTRSPGPLRRRSPVIAFVVAAQRHLIAATTSLGIDGSALLGADLDLQVPVSVGDGTYRATLVLTALS